MPGTGSATICGAPGGGGMVTSSQAPACTRSDLIAGAAVDQHVAGADQLGGLGAGEAEQAGQRRVQPLAGEAVGHGERTSVGHLLSIADFCRLAPTGRSRHRTT